MFQLEVIPGEPYLMKKEIAHRWELSGIIGVTGDYKGIVSIRLSRVLADRMLRRSGLVVTSPEEREDTLYGMIGELINIVAGNASSQLSPNVDISPPIIVLGRNHSIAWPRTIPVISIPFASALGPLEVAVCFQRKDFLASL